MTNTELQVKHTCCNVSRSGLGSSRCSKPSKIEVDGMHYCGIHNPIAIAEKNARKHAEWKAKHDAIDAARDAAKAKQAEIERRADCYTELLEALKELAEAGAEAWGKNRPCVRDALLSIAKAEGKA